MLDLRERACTSCSLVLAGAAAVHVAVTLASGNPVGALAGTAMLLASAGVVFVGDARDCARAAMAGLAAVALSLAMGHAAPATISGTYVALAGVTWVLRPRPGGMPAPSTMSHG